MNIIDLHTLKNYLTIIQTFNDFFGITDQLEFKVGRGAMTVADIKNNKTKATISLDGGQIMTFQPHQQEPVVWLSLFAPLNQKKPIRGGIPICWPWFGPYSTDTDKPAHGLARTTLWTVTDTKILENGAIRLSLLLEANEITWTLWPHAFQLKLIITVGSELRVELITHNLGGDAFTIGEALHTYFNVSDVTQVTIRGLENCQYIDKVDHSQRKRQKEVITIKSETDRIYLNTTADCIIEDPGLKRRIRIAKENSQSTVVWNPWIEKAARLGDLGYQGYLRMLCIETANVADNVVTVAPGTEHRLQMVISVESLRSG